ncbi:hypothetical protein OSTOST_13752 [Ostertagia ostertagi]
MVVLYVWDGTTVGKAEGIVDDSLETSVPVKQEVCSAEGASGNQCKSEVEESAQVNGTTEVDDDKDVSLLEIMETFSADIEASEKRLMNWRPCLKACSA